jgi:hypothetical protein
MDAQSHVLRLANCGAQLGAALFTASTEASMRESQRRATWTNSAQTVGRACGTWTRFFARCYAAQTTSARPHPRYPATGNGARAGS